MHEPRTSRRPEWQHSNATPKVGHRPHGSAAAQSPDLRRSTPRLPAAGERRTQQRRQRPPIRPKRTSCPPITRAPVLAREGLGRARTVTHEMLEERPITYDFRTIERAWQDRWERDGIYRVDDNDPRPKYYVLEMLPYRRGDLHVGHAKNYTLGDAVARMMRMSGYNVVHPMGWDAFGLPAENAAIQRGIAPETWTRSNIANMERQIRLMGTGYDWSREFATCDPEYYRWNQWFFLRMYEKGLAYKREAPVNWCPVDQTVLANEQVGRRCVLAVRQRRRTAQTFAVVPEDHPVCGPAAGGNRTARGLADAHQNDAAQLDRQERRRHVLVRYRRSRGENRSLHHARRHGLRRDVSRAGGGASGGRADRADIPGAARADRSVRRRSAHEIRVGAHAADGQNGHLLRRLRDQSAVARKGTDLDHQLRAGRLRHGRGDGRPRARRPRFRLRSRALAAGRAGDRRACGYSGCAAARSLRRRRTADRQR